MTEKGLAGLTPDRVEAIWPEPLSFDVDPSGAIILCNGRIYLQDKGWSVRGEPRASSTEFTFEPHRAHPGAPCKAQLRSVSINSYSFTLREAKRAGDALTRAVWPSQLPYPARSSDQNDPRWGRAAEWDGWIKSLSYYYGHDPAIMGGIEVYLVKLSSGWRVSGELIAIYVDTQ